MVGGRITTITLSISGGSAPVVNPATLSVTLPVTLLQNIGSPITASNNPTSWAITGGNLTDSGASAFGITNTGQIYANTTDLLPQSYSLTVQATNSSGSGQGAVTVNVSTIGTVYYVATNGSDSNNGLSPAAAFATFNKAATTVANPGDTVLFLGGTYTPTSGCLIGVGGNSSNPIVFAPYQGASVTLSGVNMASSTHIVKSTVSNISVIGLNITTVAGTSNTISGFFTAGTSNNRVIGCTVTNTWSTGIFFTGSSQVAKNNTVFNCVQQNANQAMANVNNVAWGQGISCYAANSTISGNTIHFNWGEGIGIQQTSGVLVQGNTVYDNFSININPSSCNTITVDKNFVYATGAMPGYTIPITHGIQFDQVAAGTWGNGHIATNNIVVGSYSGIGFNYSATTNPFSNALIANNTIVLTTHASFDFNSGTYSGNTVEDNIIYGGNPNTAQGQTGITYSNNCWSNATPGVLAGTGDVNANPNFFGPPGTFVATNYQVAQGSPCKNAGANLYSSGVTQDFGGNARPSSGNTTIGAWQ